MKKYLSAGQKGAVSFLLLAAVVGGLAFLAIAYFSPFKDSLFSSLYPKQSSQASGVVDLSLVPANLSIETGKTFLVDVGIDAKTDQPSAADITIKYDASKLEAISVQQGSFFTQVLQPVSINNGTIKFTFGQAPNQYKTGTGSVATLQFKALSSTSPTTSVTFDQATTQIASIGKTGNTLGLASDSVVTVTAVSNVVKTAEFSLSPASGAISSAEFPVQVMVKNAVNEANLFSARIKYDATKLEVLRVDQAGSFITQWVSGTDTFNNSTGTVSVIGGVQNPGYKTGATPVKMATVVFKAKGSGTAAVTFDGTSAIYRNSDNADILLSSSGGNYSASGTTPTPTPSGTPAPSPSIGVSATPTPTPTATPVSSPSPTASASGTPGACNISAASWITSANPILEKKIVNMKVTGTGNCAGQLVSLQVREDDGIFGTDPAFNKPTSPIKFGSNNEALGSWLTEFQSDGFNGINNPPEYYFTAQLQGGAQVNSINPLLQVTLAPTGSVIKGDANRDNKFDLADLSVLLTNWSKATNVDDVLDTNDDGVINAFDFAYLIQLLRTEGVIQ